MLGEKSNKVLKHVILFIVIAIILVTIIVLLHKSTCVGNCYGKDCGDNGCGGICGSCDGNSSCNAQGQCVLPTIDIGGNDSNPVLYSLDFGKTWSPSKSIIKSCSDIKYNGISFLAGNGTINSFPVVSSSSDGINWVSVNDLNVLDYCSCIGWNSDSNIWICCGSNKLAYSTDLGKSWTIDPTFSYTSSCINCIGDTWVIGYNNNNVTVGGIVYGNPSNGWNTVQNISFPIFRLCSTGSMLLAGSHDTSGKNTLLYSSDGKLWENIELPTVNNNSIVVVYAIEYSKITKRLVASSMDSDGNSYMIYSDNMYDWKLSNNQPFSIFGCTSIKYIGNTWFAGGSNANTNLLCYSQDGVQWTDTTVSLIPLCIASSSV